MDALPSWLGQVGSLALTGGLFIGICVILRPRGLGVVLRACMFVATLVSTQLAVKVVESPPYNYKFPGLVTTFHFLLVSVVSAAYWIWVGQPGKCMPWSIPPSRWCRTVFPVAVSQPISVVLNNKAMVYAGAGVCAIIGTLSPVATALLSSCCGRQLSSLSWLGVGVAFGGAVVISWGEVTQVGILGRGSSTLQGLLYAFASLFGRCAKIVILDYMMAPLAYANGKKSGDTEEPLSLMHVLVLCYPWGALLSLMYSLASGEKPHTAWEQLTPALAGIILISGVSALALNFLGTSVLKDLGASSQQIVGKLNTICIASISVAFLGEHLPAVVVLGSCLVLAGVATFERGEHRSEAARQRLNTSDHSEADTADTSDADSEKG